MGVNTPEQVNTKSATHWIWTPFMDISNMGPLEIKSMLGYRGEAWTMFKRCTPYPLGNMSRQEVDRAETVTPKVDYVKYAQEQAAELGDSYGDDHGLRILTPLIGMDDPEIVGQIFLAVQPHAYSLSEMTMELTVGARSRIAQSTLSTAERTIALALLPIMTRGAEIAMRKATREYDALISSMSDKMAGQPGIANPNEHHVWICEQLGKPVPRRIDPTPQRQSGGMDSSLVKALLDRDAERAKELDELRRLMAAKTAEPASTEV
jgi:hypothetical protein